MPTKPRRIGFTITDVKEKGVLTVIKAMITGIALGLLCIIALNRAVATHQPSPPNQSEFIPIPASQILDKDGHILMTRGQYLYEPVTLNQVPDNCIQVLLSTEDRRFYQHSGADLRGILRAMQTDIRSRKLEEGGSTLTQQLARSIYLTHEKTFSRKLQETLLALRLERQYNKTQLLTMYLNSMYFGQGAYGIGAASHVYFNKKPQNLTIPQCATLVGAMKAPSELNPYYHPDASRKRRNEVLANLAETGHLNPSEVAHFQQTPLGLQPKAKNSAIQIKAPYFSRYVVREAMDQLHLDSEEAFWKKRVRIITTLDPQAQAIAERQVVHWSQVSRRTGPRQQAALLSVSNDGKMIAYVGGKNYRQSQYDRVADAHRQAGSLFKVFVYTTAIENGFSPLAIYDDSPVQFERYNNWRPENYGKTHVGYTTLASAFVHSNNIIAAKITNELGPNAVAATAHHLGIHSELPTSLAISLGAADVTLLEMTGAFNTFSNHGDWVKPYSIVSITDRQGNEIYYHDDNPQSVLNPDVRDMMVSMMSGVLRFGTGRAANLGYPAAGKTGTSEHYKDAWFIGFTPEVTTGVWVGNDDGTPMPGISGGTLPARIWRGYMGSLLAHRSKGDFELVHSLRDEDFLGPHNMNSIAMGGGHSAEEKFQPLWDDSNTKDILTGELAPDEPVMMLGVEEKPEQLGLTDEDARPAPPMPVVIRGEDIEDPKRLVPPKEALPARPFPEDRFHEAVKEQN